MVKERVTEIFDFATSTSPYRKANKGWLTDDVYLQIGNPSTESTRPTKKVVDVLLFWEPIKRLISILFLVIAISSLLVVTAISYSHGNFHISLKVPSISSEVNQLKRSDMQDDVTIDLEIRNSEIVALQDQETEDLSLTITNEVQIAPKEEELAIQQDIKPKPKDSLGSAGNLF